MQTHMCMYAYTHTHTHRCLVIMSGELHAIERTQLTALAFTWEGSNDTMSTWNSILCSVL